MKPCTLSVHTFINLTLFFVISCVGVSCNNNSKSETFDIKKRDTFSAVTTAITIDGEAFQPQTTEAFLKTQEGKIVLTLASYADNEGVSFEIKTPTLENIQGEHSLNSDYNKVLYNIADSSQITTYHSSHCKDDKGQITIQKFDAEKNTITGKLKAKVCTPNANTQHKVMIQFSDIQVVNL